MPFLCSDSSFLPFSLHPFLLYLLFQYQWERWFVSTTDQLLLLRGNCLTAVRGGVLLYACLCGLGSHSSSELVPVITAIMKCTRRYPWPPAYQRDILSVLCRARTLAYIHTHSQSFTVRTRSLLPHTLTHTVPCRSGDKKKRTTRKKEIRISCLLWFSLYVTNCCWLWVLNRNNDPDTLSLTHTHTSPPQPRILGLVRPGVECGSRGVDQHGEPSRETGGNGVRSAFVVSWFSSFSRFLFVFWLV